MPPHSFLLALLENMSLPLVYIDQNIIGLQLDGRLKLSKQNDFCWVYSKEHFVEIRRSSNAHRYLSVLEELDAKLLELNLNSDCKIIGTATLVEQGTASQHYESYIKTMGDVDFDESLFDPLQAWLNGGGDEGPLKDLPSVLVKQVSNITKDYLPVKDEINEKVNSITPEFKNTIGQIIANGNDINATRKMLGDGKGTIGGIKGKNLISQIWDIIGPTCAEVSPDQFFGFNPVDKQGYETWPIYLGIVGCCAVLDIVGFQAEKKCRKIDKIPNIRSDAGHIAMGAFCSAILSEDRRLIKRAKAIYEYKDINTSTLLVRKRLNWGSDQDNRLTLYEKKHIF